MRIPLNLFILLAPIAIFGTACTSGGLGIENLPLIETQESGRMMPYYPADGVVVGVNPPGFFWPVREDAEAYNFLLFSEDDENTLIQQAGLTSSIAILKDPLPAGKYEWQVVFVDELGQWFGRAKRRSFAVEGETQELAMPDVGALTARLSNVRPRIFLADDGDLAKRIAALADSGDATWKYFISRANLALDEPLYPEPAPYKDGEFEVGEWRRIYTPGKRGSAHLLRLALAWRVTGEEKYLAGARKWLLHLSDWDPDGITSYNLPLSDGSTGNDEAGMPMLERMAIAYDWIGERLTEEERKKVLECLRRRGNQILEHYREVDFISAPWSNHDVRVLAFLGFAALSCLGEVDDAEQWLDYVLRCYLTTYPTWGSDDGGWAQGLSYWAAYVGWNTNFVVAFQGATGIDLFRKPFFRNNGYFAVYFHPPYAQRGGFGDNGGAAPSMPEKLLLQKYASAMHDPVLLWQSEQIVVTDGIDSKLQVSEKDPDWKEWHVEDVFSLMCPKPEDLVPQSPAGLPGSKWLKDIGWVAFHSELGDSEQDVWALFKSSRYGSFSHSHADQNSFQLNAWGRALLIDSGYYPWYSSPHHNLWTRQTHAHNAVLVNGLGQGSSSMDASGKIEEFHTREGLTVTMGEAARAYNVPMNEFTREQWQEHLSGTPVPADNNKVLTARRTLAFRGEGEMAWLAVHDFLATEEPATFQFLLHALEKMDLEPGTGSLTVKNGGVHCLVRLLCSEPVVFDQTDQFNLPPEERFQGAANQWHFSAGTQNNAAEVKYFAVMVPFKASEGPPRVEVVQEEDWRGFEINGERVLAWWGEGETGKGAGKPDPGRIWIDWTDKGIKKTDLF